MMRMPLLTLVAGSLLIAVGILIGLAVDSDSITRFIPAFVGLPILICGLVAMSREFRKHAVHAALVIALLGAVASGIRIPTTFSNGSGAALTSQVLMCLICLGYVILGVRSFIRARRERHTAAAA